MNIKDTLRKLLNFLHLDITKNLEYDRLTKVIMQQVINSNSNCIDVGCHKGEMLDEILKLAPQGKHIGFEPIPIFYNNLKDKYANKATIYNYALAAKEGIATFNYVTNDPAYSGLQKRSYDIKNPEIEIIDVQQKKLDNLIAETDHIHFIKIDVEGGEFDVLQGASKTISRCKPIIIFECGNGASNYYGTTADALYNFMCNDLGMQINTLKAYIKKNPALSATAFHNYFETASEYYYVAYWN